MQKHIRTAALAAAMLGGLWSFTASAAETPHGWVLLEATVSDVTQTPGQAPAIVMPPLPQPRTQFCFGAGAFEQCQ
jgi:hypothetical protein